jgi:tetratricopeptide (TPR) repeat protein
LRRRDPAQACAHFEQARTHHDAALRENPRLPRYREASAESHVFLGFVLGDMQDWEAARTAFHTALEIRQRLADEFPTYPDYRARLADTYFDLANSLRLAGKRDQAEDPHRKAVAIQREIAEAYPDFPDYRQALAQRYSSLAILLTELKRPSDAEDAFRTTIDVQQHLTNKFPDVPDYRGDLAISQSNLSELRLYANAPEDARKLLEEAVRNIEESLKANPGNPWYRVFYAEILANTGCTAAALGDREKAEAMVERLRAGISQPRYDFYFAACVLSNCMKFVGRDTKLPEARRLELSRSYGDKAVDLLRQAVQAGSRNASMIMHEDRLEAIRDRDDLKKLIADLEAQKKPARSAPAEQSANGTQP